MASPSCRLEKNKFIKRERAHFAPVIQGSCAQLTNAASTPAWRAGASSSHTHFLPGSSEEGRAWPGASLSGSCPPDTLSFSVKVEKNKIRRRQWISLIASLGYWMLNRTANTELHQNVSSTKEALTPLHMWSSVHADPQRTPCCCTVQSAAGLASLRHLRSCQAAPLQTGRSGNALPSRVTAS